MQVTYGKGCRRSAPEKLAARAALHEHPDVAARLAAHREGRVALPASVDLAAFQPPILDQGQTSACTAFSTSSAIATRFASAGKPLGFVPSQRCIYATTRALERAGALPPDANLPALTDSGAELADVVTVLGRYGVLPMAGLSGDVDPSSVNLEPDVGALEQAAAKLVVGERGLTPTASEAGDVIVAALMSGIPVVVAAFVDSAFENLSSGAVAGAPNEADPSGGGHALYISGAQTMADGSRALIVTNSWGPSWCNAGRGLVSEAWLAAAWELWSFDVSLTGGAQ